MVRAGRFGTKGLAITFVSEEDGARILNDIQDRFEVNVAELPEEIDSACWGGGGMGAELRRALGRAGPWGCPHPHPRPVPSPVN